MPPTPDILFENGHFWTGNPILPEAGHLLSSNGRIKNIGMEGTLHGSFGDVVDLKGCFAMPGFIDAHTHFRVGGASLKRLDLRSVRGHSEFSEAVRIRAKSHPDGKWLLGGNWDHESWGRDGLPSKYLIDEFTSSFPVFLDRIDTHMALMNTRALNLAGITRETPDPPGGVFVRDDRGELTGIVKDAAREMVMHSIPEPPLEELMDDVRTAMEHANEFGVTSVNEIGPERDLNAYVELGKRRELTVRIRMVLPVSQLSILTGKEIRADGRRGDDEWIKLGAVKAFADGSLGAGTAWFFDPYDDDRLNAGLPTEILTSGDLERYALEADRNHIQLAIHAIGDKAASNVLDIFEKVDSTNPRWDRRFRIEHAQHLAVSDLSRFERLKVVASVQPYHCIDDGRWAERRIGKRRAKEAFAFRSLIDKNVTLAFGTDWPVAPLNPLESVYAAVTRATTDGKKTDGWIAEQKITVEEALKAYTCGSAHASFSESEVGTLEAGKFSDFVVLSQDPFQVQPEEIRNIKIVLTVVGGRIVFADEEAFGVKTS